MTLQEIIQGAKDDLINEFDPDDQYPEDRLTEIADSAVPIYTHDLMTLSSEPDIFFHENELGPAFDGSPTLANITATAIYELVSQALYETLYELQAEAELQEAA
ncbi:hypothetical protein [Mariprofundus ferrooxydans]|uniref:hypothetical protein n=1 Tax=Mariprofundus ferrooxydans TaxID=314344 RepID=UPI0014309F2B|nr:hypothetical protein [Mariprofundus ferrooxydans]